MCYVRKYRVVYSAVSCVHTTAGNLLSTRSFLCSSGTLDKSKGLSDLNASAEIRGLCAHLQNIKFG